MTTSVQDSKKVLQGIKHQDPATAKADPANMYDHVTDILVKLLDERYSNPLEIFESVSNYAKGARAGGQPSYVPEAKISKYFPLPPKSKRTEITLPTDQSWAQPFVKYFEKPQKKKKAEGEEGEPEEEEQPEEEEVDESVGVPPNLVGERRALETVGLGLTEEETYSLFFSISRLVKEKKLKSARLFGKILGTQQNYYVVEGEYTTEFREEREAKLEEERQAKLAEAAGENADGGDGGDAEGAEGGAAGGDIIPRTAPVREVVPAEKFLGSNRFTYFVTNTVSGAWEELPDLEPAQILAARKIRKYFTGNLDAPVNAHPPFPGQERHYLRAQLARIACATTLAPKGMYALPEEDAPADSDEAPTGPTFEPPTELKELTVSDPFVSMAAKIEEIEGSDADPKPEPKIGLHSASMVKDIENWVHVQPHLSHVQGRTTLYKPEPADGEEENDDEDEDEQKPKIKTAAELERVPPLLHPVSQDRPVWGQPAWSIHIFPSALPQRQEFIVANARSLRWPGAHSLVFTQADQSGKPSTAKSLNIYIGYGQRAAERANVYSPILPASIHSQFDAAQLVEQPDPSPEIEKEFEEPPPPPPPAPIVEPPAEGEGQQQEGEGENEGEQEENPEAEDE